MTFCSLNLKVKVGWTVALVEPFNKTLPVFKKNKINRAIPIEKKFFKKKPMEKKT